MPKKDTPIEIIKPKDEIEIEIVAVGNHKVKLNKNKTRYIVVSDGDTFYRLSKEFGISLWQLYKYNELGKRDVLKKGEIIYLEPKRGRSKKGSNIYICEKKKMYTDGYVKSSDVLGWTLENKVTGST